MSGKIEFVSGQEEHSSNWGKFYVKRLEKWQVIEDFKENIKDRHHSYQGFTCLGIEEGTIFTILEQSGTKRGTEAFYFTICQFLSSEKTGREEADYGRGFCEGNFKILARGAGKTKAPRLMNWWVGSKDKSLEFALHCAKWIEKRGIKEIPPM